MAKIIGNTTATPNPRPDWAQTDETKADYIKNKPILIGTSTPEGGEIFNNYENNKAISKYASASGSNTQAGSKAFTVVGVIQDSDNPDAGIYTVDIAFDDPIMVELREQYAKDAADKDIPTPTFSVHLAQSDEVNHNSLQCDNVGTIIEFRQNTNPEFTDIQVSQLFDAERTGAESIASVVSKFQVWSNYLETDGTDSEINTFRIPAYPNLGNRNIGSRSHAEGLLTQALSKGAHAEGTRTIAEGSWSHAEGRKTYAAYSAHAEGVNSRALGQYSHAEGDDTEASHFYAHAEGKGTVSFGIASHAEGYGSRAEGKGSHSEGIDTDAEGIASHAEGKDTHATDGYSHAEGLGSMASYGAHAEGYQTEATGSYSHSQGYATMATAWASHAEGQETHAIAAHAHAEGRETIASGVRSHAQGYMSQATGEDSFASGKSTVAEGARTVAQGSGSKAIGGNSFASGNGTTANGWNSATFNSGTTTEGTNSFAAGESTLAKGVDSFAIGKSTQAIGNNTFTTGRATIAGYENQAVVGKYNNNKSSTLFEVGNGTYDTNRSNAFEVYSDGHAEVQTQGTTDSSIATKKYIDDTKQELSSKIDTITSAGLKREIVSKLPSVSDANENTIYMVGAKNDGTYDEYLFINFPLTTSDSFGIDGWIIGEPSEYPYSRTGFSPVDGSSPDTITFSIGDEKISFHSQKLHDFVVNLVAYNPNCTFDFTFTSSNSGSYVLHLDNGYELIGSTSVDLNNYYTKGEVDTKIEDLADFIDDFNSDISNLYDIKADITYVDNAVANAGSVDLSNYYTKDEIDSAKDGILLKDTVTGEIYKICITNGKLTAEVAE